VLSGLKRLPPEVAALAAVAFMVALGFGVVAPAIPLFARHFDVSKTEASAVISAFAAARLVTAPFAGRLVNAFGERTMLATGIGIVGVSSLLAGLSSDCWQLLVLRGIGGVGSIMFSVSASSLLIRVTPPHLRGRAQGVFAGGFLIGSIAGPALGFVAAWSLRAPFFLYGCLLVVPAILAAVVLRRVPNRRQAGQRAPAGSLATLARAVRNRTWRAAASANLADGFAALGVRGALVPLFVREILHRSAVWTGIGFLLFAALNGAALLPGGRVADTLGRRPVIIAGCAVSAVGMVMLAVLSGPWAYLAALAVAGFGSGLLDVAPAAMIGDIIDRDGGTVVASYQMAGDVGSVIGPVAGGFLVDSASYGAAFGLAAAVLGGAALLGSAAPETRPGEPAMPSAVTGPESRVR
jgi:MFS transporter, DHA1 family, multidrug resistance protein